MFWEDFPNGFAHCELALRARIFEASHTYKLKGLNQYLTVMEENGRRYYKAYLASKLDGEWKPIWIAHVAQGDGIDLIDVARDERRERVLGLVIDVLTQQRSVVQFLHL